ncbi:MAG: hypothetical protein IK020_12965 [Clostridiales bacterium]|nr:hypothetical protein [Clostridiales bacterium]
MATQPRKIRQAWYDYAVQFCEKEDYLTHAEHLMIVSRKDAEERAASKKHRRRKAESQKTPERDGFAVVE